MTTVQANTVRINETHTNEAESITRLIEDNLELVNHIVFQVAIHFPRHVDRDDLARAGALGLGLGEEVGDFQVGRRFDAVWLRPPSQSTLDIVLRHAPDASDALAKLFALGGPADVAGVWVDGRSLTTPAPSTTRPALVPSMITA
jgi:guanine deaminase